MRLFEEILLLWTEEKDGFCFLNKYNEHPYLYLKSCNFYIVPKFVSF